MQKISITHVNNLHNDWQRGLDFYKEELDILKSRLGEIAFKNTATETMQDVEHYENAFKVQRDNIDRLGHEIKLNVAFISKQAQDSKAGYIDKALQVQHDQLEDKYAIQEKSINELRKSFNYFASKWM